MFVNDAASSFMCVCWIPAASVIPSVKLQLMILFFIFFRISEKYNLIKCFLFFTVSNIHFFVFLHYKTSLTFYSGNF